MAPDSKGREKAILEMDLKIDDLLEKKNQGVDSLDMEYVSLNVNKVLALLNKYVAAREMVSHNRRL